ncbi:hypothetical protein DICVIV_12345 [Dictyocaulus viviparus]|uniref:Uncharacterized protein n=1 Tax=Dictyocaulus viviparus TaxID=29172 RepID=A0A0D8XAR2_DICVI|nr:hypothetical protein DICVIV_12345 [Dictyocaulus viviparus]
MLRKLRFAEWLEISFILASFEKTYIWIRYS